LVTTFSIKLERAQTDVADRTESFYGGSRAGLGLPLAFGSNQSDPPFSCSGFRTHFWTRSNAASFRNQGFGHLINAVLFSHSGFGLDILTLL